MKAITTIFLAVGTALMLSACVTSSGASGSDVVMKVNGREVTSVDLIKSPMVRQAIKQYLIADALMREAGKEGLTPDEQAINEQIDQIEQDALSQGMTIDEYLQQQFLTVEEVKESIRMQQMFDKLIEAKAAITDEDRNEYWEQHSEEIKYAYARENHLTEAEATELTREDVSEQLDSMLRRQNEGQTRQTMMESLINGIDLELVAISNQEEAEHYEDLIINLSKTDEEEEAAVPGAQMPPDAGAAGTASSVGEGPGAGDAEESDESAVNEEDQAADDSGEGEADEAEAQAEPEAGDEEAEDEAGTDGE